jgi:hypothetical protein
VVDVQDEQPPAEVAQVASGQQPQQRDAVGAARDEREHDRAGWQHVVLGDGGACDVG